MSSEGGSKAEGRFPLLQCELREGSKEWEGSLCCSVSLEKAARNGRIPSAQQCELRGRQQGMGGFPLLQCELRGRQQGMGRFPLLQCELKEGSKEWEGSLCCSVSSEGGSKEWERSLCCSVNSEEGSKELDVFESVIMMMSLWWIHNS